jgi:hypothetical protein
LASGDILVLLDALMYRLGEGLPGTPPARPPIEEVRPADEEDRVDSETPLPPSYELLAETCRSKVGRLIRRMTKQLDAVQPSGAQRAVVQLAAVLSVVHTLRVMEQRIEWRSKNLKLVDPAHEWLLLERGGLRLAWGNSSLIPRALKETDGELFQELSMAIGLLAWLAWDVGIDVRSAVERTMTTDPDGEDDLWHRIQVFASVAARLAVDVDAQDMLSRAAVRTGRRGVDVGKWLANHLALAGRLLRVAENPGGFTKPDRTPRAGDLVTLGSALDPRVRVALAVTASGTTYKIRVFEPEVEGYSRQFVATHVMYMPWWERERAPKRAGGIA